MGKFFSEHGQFASEDYVHHTLSWGIACEIYFVAGLGGSRLGARSRRAQYPTRSSGLHAGEVLGSANLLAPPSTAMRKQPNKAPEPTPPAAGFSQDSVDFAVVAGVAHL